MSDLPTTTDLLAEATSILETSGYRTLTDAEIYWPSQFSRVLEDALSIVAIVVFDDWRALETSWNEAQSTLVELVSSRIMGVDAKAWDGYLVLLTPGSAGADRSGVEMIRYDVTRVRKLVADGDDLSDLGAVEHVLAPLLPLSNGTESTLANQGPFDLLSEALEKRGLDAGMIAALIEAFEEQRPLMSAIDDWRSKHAAG